MGPPVTDSSRLILNLVPIGQIRRYASRAPAARSTIGHQMPTMRRPYRFRIPDTSEMPPKSLVTEIRAETSPKLGASNLSTQRFVSARRDASLDAASQVRDSHEQEAARGADRLAQPPASTHAKVVGPSLGSGESAQINFPVPLGSGIPLDNHARTVMEALLDHDFSKIRVHANARAGVMARTAGARAYTVGDHVVFGDGRNSPSSADGNRLLAHELVHVAQRSGPRPDSAASASVVGQSLKSNRPQISVGAAPAGVPQFERDAGAPQFNGSANADNYIGEYHNFFTGLDTAKLASDLCRLVCESAGNYTFVSSVFDKIDENERQQLALDFFRQRSGDSWLHELALRDNGRRFLTRIAGYLEPGSMRREGVESIVRAGPQAAVEKERLTSVDALKRHGATKDVTIYTSYREMDAAEAQLRTFAQERLRTGRTDAAFPMEQFEDILAILSRLSKTLGPDFVRELHLMGHGGEDKFGFGIHYYRSKDLERFRSGLLADFMAPGATIYLEGCEVAQGTAGLNYLKEIGRIFFGDQKSGYIKGNTEKVVGIGDITERKPRTLRWPADFN